MSSTWPRPHPVFTARADRASAVLTETLQGIDTLGPSCEALRPALFLFPPLGIFDLILYAVGDRTGGIVFPTFKYLRFVTVVVINSFTLVP